MKTRKSCILFALLLTAGGCTAAQPHMPPRLPGAVLSSCSGSPNCVSSQSDDPDRSIAPFKFSGSPEAAFTRLHTILAERSDTRFIVETPTYIKVEFSTLLGFKDDGEFYLDAKKGVIECRSESRSGFWDLGKNRRRLEDIRKQFNPPKEEAETCPEPAK
ncbi:MAG: DUF1499 domain-containing protein [Geobacteraceae bacterium]